MEFKKEDENYIYEVISKNVKKYRKLKGWTQERLAEEINYSLSFIRGIESNCHQTFSLGAIYRIARVLEIDFNKLCEDTNTTNNKKFIMYQCNKCGVEVKIPSEIAKHFKNIYEIAGNKNTPYFDCTECDGKIFPVNPMDF